MEGRASCLDCVFYCACFLFMCAWLLVCFTEFARVAGAAAGLHLPPAPRVRAQHARVLRLHGHTVHMRRLPWPARLLLHGHGFGGLRLSLLRLFSCEGGKEKAGITCINYDTRERINLWVIFFMSALSLSSSSSPPPPPPSSAATTGSRDAARALGRTDGDDCY